MLLQHAAIGQDITSIPDIRALTEERARAGLSTRFDAIVTFYHQEWGVLFTHDRQDGICVGIPLDGRPTKPFQPGTKLNIEGTIGPGEFLPVVLPSSIKTIGNSTENLYVPVSGEDLFTPSLDARPVEVEAIVKGTSFAEKSLVLDLQVEGWEIRAILPHHETQNELPWQILERRVRIKGVVGTHFNDQRQMSGRLLFVPSLSFLEVIAEPDQATEAPVVPVDTVLRVHSPPRQRVKIQGVTTHVEPGTGLYLRGDGGSIFVQTAQPHTIRRGDDVEAEGYPAVTLFRPSLSAIQVRQLDSHTEVKPLPLDVKAVRNSSEQCELVQLATELVQTNAGRESHSLLCRSGNQIFEATLTNDYTLPTDLAPGATLRLTGICKLSSTRPLVIPRNATGFTIQLRDVDDLIITARQPWWNEQRALWVLAAIGGLAAIVSAWAITLQIMVRRQSSLIQRQTEQRATMEERQRIARDLHDSLEQELVGVAMLLDNTASRMSPEGSEAAEPLHLARRLLRRARDESRSTIRELRSVTLEQRGLPAAMEETLRSLAAVREIDFRFQLQGSQPYRMPGTVETHILRIAQEAVANAANHGTPRHIEVRLTYSSKNLMLEIEDDGVGFDPTSTIAATGHFGLSGMKERADKLGATFTITSRAGQTLVKLVVPTPHAAP
ncbi:MAG: sensor histidine kinase [Verrucomicrobiaceae bacterium]|nr:sensor histidine kinase [Verrucomicrobiaceae bacterium]